MPRGVRAGRNKQRTIRTVITSNRKNQQNNRGVCHQNLCQINLNHQTVCKSELNICLVNTQSARNKTDDIVQYITEKDIDVCVITETWLNSHDEVKTGDLTPAGYKLEQVVRDGRQGGGIAIILKSTCKIKKLTPVAVTDSLECMEVILTVGNGHLRLVVVYRPPRPDPSLDHCVPLSVFFDEFTTIMEPHLTAPGHLIVLGDFNFHMDILSDPVTKRFQSILQSMDLHQHVQEPTHISGHILDLVLTRSSDINFVQNLNVDMKMSDHFTILFKVKVGKPPPEKKVLTFRKLRSVDLDTFKQDLAHAITKTELSDDIELLVSQYNSVLHHILDKHAPEQTKTVTVRHHTPWYTDAIKQEKKNRRKLERKWIKTRSEDDRAKYQQQRNIVTEMISAEKSSFYSALVLEKRGDPKGLFKIINTLLHRKQDLPLPPHESDSALANDFANFFTDKIATIRLELDGLQTRVENELEEPRKYHTTLTDFAPATEMEIKDLVLKAPTKSCVLDPVPTRVLKACLVEILPLITKVVNLSLRSATMPKSLKTAVIMPVLKKIILELILKNYRPVSNLPFLSKLIERVVAKRLLAHQNGNDLQEVLQSAYKEGHSTETALTKVQNDILHALDNKQVVLLILLDLSAAFDTIDHSILLKRLSDRMGITGNALAWIRSYLQDRCQYVQVGGECSASTPLKYGVPQGSVLGPILFSMYTTSLGDVIRCHNASFHVYADDTQIYMSVQPNNQAEIEDAIQCLQDCICDVKSWMTKNMLKLNKEKTEFIMFGTPKQRSKMSVSSIDICGCNITAADHVKNLGVFFDCNMNMHRQTNAIKKSAFHHLRNLRMIRPYLTKEAAETAVHAFVTSRLDYCNSLLYGISKANLHSLQLAQNAAARLVTNTRKFDHITPVLYSLHWLPVQQRIIFKLLIMTYKAIHGLAPTYLSDLINIHQPARSLRSTNKLLLQVPRTSLVTAGDRSFRKAGPTLWNPLPTHLKSARTLSDFKRKLKTYLFNAYFGC